jgi:hypothetical protein
MCETLLTAHRPLPDSKLFTRRCSKATGDISQEQPQADLSTIKRPP